MIARRWKVAWSWRTEPDLLSYSRAASEALENSHSDFVDGADVFAVHDQDVEAGRKGQRGQYAQQHVKSVSPDNLRCACLEHDELNRLGRGSARCDAADQAFCRSLSIGITCPDIDFAASEARNTASCAMSLGSIMALIDAAASASAFTSSSDLPLICARP